jgi:hypothetical protein
MAFLPIFDAVAPVVNKILSYIPDPQQKLEAQQQLMASLMAWDSQQTQINAAEAANSSIFVSGARPFILWVCGFAVAYKFILQPFLVFIIVAFQIKFDVKLLPSLDWSEISSLMFGMLGLSGMKTYEKIQGIR